MSESSLGTSHPWCEWVAGVGRVLLASGRLQYRSNYDSESGLTFNCNSMSNFIRSVAICTTDMTGHLVVQLKCTLYYWLYCTTSELLPMCRLCWSCVLPVLTVPGCRRMCCVGGCPVSCLSKNCVSVQRNQAASWAGR